MKGKILCMLVMLAVLIAIIFVSALLTGCDSFKEVKPQVLAEYPECVVMMNTGEIYKGDKDKSGTVMPVTDCIKAIKRQRCAMEVFGKTQKIGEKEIYVVDWGADAVKMAKFDACLLK